MQHNANTVVRTLRPEDKHAWLNLRRQLWPDSEDDDAVTWTARNDATTLLAENAEDGIFGFAEVGIRPYADGCDTSPVAFLEGWYVELSHRRKDVGRRLVRAAADWARQRGLHELASDSLLEDKEANVAHIRVGFIEVERSIKYRMPLGQASDVLS